MIHQRHPVVVEAMISWLNRQVDVPCLRAAAVAADQLTGVDGFSPPSWEELAAGTSRGVPGSGGSMRFRPG